MTTLALHYRQALGLPIQGELPKVPPAPFTVKPAIQVNSASVNWPKPSIKNKG